MSKLSKIAVTLLLLAAFGAALYFSLRGQKTEVARQQEEAAVASAGAINGLIALDVEPYFKDERVRKILADKRLSVNVTRVGSREMARRISSSRPAWWRPTRSSTRPARPTWRWRSRRRFTRRW
jgi:hypothetical protein